MWYIFSIVDVDIFCYKLDQIYQVTSAKTYT
jgi:hypothetical protein